MNHELVKDIIKLNLDLMDEVTKYLPDCIKTDLLTLQKDFIEVAKEHALKQDTGNKSVQNIPIE